MPMEYDVDAILNELDGLATDYPGHGGKIKLTEDQKKILLHSQLDGHVSWPKFMEVWERLGFPGSETALKRIVRSERLRREKEDR